MIGSNSLRLIKRYSTESPAAALQALRSAEPVFRDLTRALEGLQNRKLPMLYSVFQHNEDCYSVWEFFEGSSLADEIDDTGSTVRGNVEEVKKMIRQLLESLVFLHSRGIVHGDLQPESIIHTRSGDWALVDVPFHPFLPPSGEEIRAAPDAPLFHGLVAFPSYGNGNAAGLPSQRVQPWLPNPGSYHAQTTSSDLYSLGATVLRTLTGFWPMPGKAEDLVAAVPSATPVGLRQFIMVLVAADSSQRFPTAEAALRIYERGPLPTSSFLRKGQAMANLVPPASLAPRSPRTAGDNRPSTTFSQVSNSSPRYTSAPAEPLSPPRFSLGQSNADHRSPRYQTDRDRPTVPPFDLDPSAQPDRSTRPSTVGSPLARAQAPTLTSQDQLSPKLTFTTSPRVGSAGQGRPRAAVGRSQRPEGPAAGLASESGSEPRAVEEVWEIRTGAVGIVPGAQVGVGASSTVWEGFYCGARVAVKVLPNPQGNVQANWRSRVPSVVFSLRHPGIVMLYGAGLLPSGEVAFVMELADAGSLAEHLRTRREIGQPVPIEDKLSILRRIAEVMSYIHSRPNRPDNVPLTLENILMVNGRPKLNVAKATSTTTTHAPDRSGERASLSSLSLHPNVQANASYLPPELLSPSSLEEKADVYAFALLAWELITERRVFDSVQLGNGRPPRPEVSSAFPESLRGLLESCWGSEPAARPSFEEIERLL